MKRKEVFSGIKAAPPVIMRMDGRNFKESLARLGFRRPYDVAFARGMVAAARSLLADSGLGPEWAFVFSDEVSVLFDELPFDGRVEKLDSVAASWLVERADAEPAAGHAAGLRRPGHPGAP